MAVAISRSFFLLIIIWLWKLTGLPLLIVPCDILFYIMGMQMKTLGHLRNLISANGRQNRRLKSNREGKAKLGI